MKETNIIHQGVSLEILQTLPSDSVDSIVTDPPYGFKFMGRKWDYDVPSTEIWMECLRVLKPGGFLLAFAGTRTQHRMAVRIEDAGFEIRDMIAWVYGSGFPKSLDVSKAIDKAAGAEREVVGFDPIAAKRTAAVATNSYGDYKGQTGDVTAPATDAARQWEGWGTALKPALEPITVARKPLIGTVAENVLEHGTGALNIDGCRVDASDGRPLIQSKGEDSRNCYGNGLSGSKHIGVTTEGRWPANLIHDGSEEVLQQFPDTSSGKMKQRIEGGQFNTYGRQYPREVETIGDSGSAARFFYCAKASKADRGEGNNHPTVKPTALMRYLCRLVTPPGGIILDPFAGSGTTGVGAILEGFRVILIEREAESVNIASARIASAIDDYNEKNSQLKLF